MSTMTQTTVQVYNVFIKATPEAIWEAITKPEFTSKYFYGSLVESTLEPGSPIIGWSPDHEREGKSVTVAHEPGSESVGAERGRATGSLPGGGPDGPLA